MCVFTQLQRCTHVVRWSYLCNFNDSSAVSPNDSVPKCYWVNLEICKSVRGH